MRAAVVDSVGDVPVVEEFVDPAGDDVAEVVAAALNPFDVIVAAGQIPARQPSPPFIVGVEGIARLGDGTLSYFAGPKLPYGSLAERVPLTGADTAAVPVGLDPALAAALGISGFAAWLSLTATGRLALGEKVLILGAEGQVGQLATQLARRLGASLVVGAVELTRTATWSSNMERMPPSRRPTLTPSANGSGRRSATASISSSTWFGGRSSPMRSTSPALAPGSSRSATPPTLRRRWRRPPFATGWSAFCPTPTGPFLARSAELPSNSSRRTPSVASCNSMLNVCHSTRQRRPGRKSRPGPPPANS